MGTWNYHTKEKDNTNNSNIPKNNTDDKNNNNTNNILESFRVDIPFTDEDLDRLIDGTYFEYNEIKNTSTI